MTDALPSPNAICPACEQSFVCGMVAGTARCWCYALPHSQPVPAPATALAGDNPLVAGCFCPSCMQLRLNVPTTDSKVATTAPTDPDGPP